MNPLSRRKPRPIKRRKKRTPLSQEIKSMYRVLTITIIILGVTATGAYLYTNSLKPAKGYTLKQLQIDYESLESDQRALDHQIIEAQSFIKIEDEIPTDMVETNTEDYSYIEDSAYAQNY